MPAPLAGAPGAVGPRPARASRAAQSDQTAYKTQLHSVLEMRRMLAVFEIAWRNAALPLPPLKMAMLQFGMDREPSSRRG